MTKYVSYERGEGGYTLTEEQRTALQNLRDTLAAQLQSSSDAEVGLGVPIYQMLLDLISYEIQLTEPEDGSEGIVVRIPVAGVDPAVYRWIEGAVRVNAGDGFFADFIREYTKIQYQLRGGEPGQAERLNQLASNSIALNLANDIIANQGVLPGISGLGALDAGAAASTVFENIPGSEGADYAPWAGTLLFPFLGSDSYITDILFSTEQVIATIDRGAAGFDDPKIIKYVEGTYDLIAAIQSARLASMQAVLNAGPDFLLNAREALINLIYPDVLDTNQHDLMAQANVFFNQYYDLTGAEGFAVGADLLFNRVNEFWEGITFSPDINYVVGTYGDDANLSPESLNTRAIIHAGDGNDTVTGSERSDLIDGGEGNDTLTGWGGEDYLYGGAGNDDISGGNENDRLVGMTGNDELTGGLGNDDLQGGEGDDYYYFAYGDGFDHIVDAQGANRIYLQHTDSQTGYSGLSGVSLTEIAPSSGIYAQIDSETKQPINNTRYVFNDDDLMISIDGGDGGRITIENFNPQSNTFGLTFNDYADPISPIPTDPDVFTGTAADELIDLNYHANHERTWDEVNGGDGHDYIWGSGESDLVYGNAGDDWMHGNNGAPDTFFGGDGNDFIMDASPGTHGYGEAGNDMLSASVGFQFDVGVYAWQSFSAWQALRQYLQPGFATYVTQEGEAEIYHSSVWAGFVPGTYTGTVDTGLSTETPYTLVVEGSTTSSPQSGFHSGSGINDAVDELQFYSHDQLQSDDQLGHVVSWFPIILNVNEGWTEELAAEIAGVTFDGGEGNDLLHGWYTSDTLIGGTGDDYLSGEGGHDMLIGGQGNDILAGGLHNDTLVGGDDDDVLMDYHGNNSLYGGAGNDNLSIYHLEGTSGDNYLDGGSGDDTITGGDGNDTLLGGDGFDTLYGRNGNDQLYGGENIDVLFGGEGDDTLHGGNGNDELQGQQGNDWLYGEAGNDLMTGGEGDDWLSGGQDDDQLLGDDGNDTLIGGAGVDVMAGGAGDDTYIIYSGDGGVLDNGVGDTVIDNNGSNTIIFAGTGVTGLMQTSSAVQINYGQGEGVVMNNSTFNTINSFLVNGTEYTDFEFYHYLNSRGALGANTPDSIYGGDGDDRLFGGGGNDSLIGRSGNNVLYGGTGDDSLYGGEGQDTYVYYSGDGSDTIRTGSGSNQRDILSFGEGIEADDIQLGRPVFRDLNITVGDNGETIVLDDYFYGNDEIDIHLKDGEVITHEDIKQALLSGTDGADSIYGYETDDVIYGMAGDDELNGDDGNDTLEGGAGDDTLHGGSGSNVMVGGLGNDRFYGVGNDVYLFGAGDGHDQIYLNGGNASTLVLGSGITPEELSVSRLTGSSSGGYPTGISITFAGSEDRVDISFYFNSEGTENGRLSSIVFADYPEVIWNAGTIRPLLIVPTEDDDSIYGFATDDILFGANGDDTIRGYDGNDQIYGGQGDDDLYGGRGNDVYHFSYGDGNDIIFNDSSVSDTDEENDYDVIRFGEGITEDDILIENNYNEVKFILASTGESIRADIAMGQVRGIDAVEFVGGITWNVETIRDKVFASTDGDDTIYGFAGDDVIDGGLGNDTIRSGKGDNVIYGGEGDDELFASSGSDELYGGNGDDTLLGDAFLIIGSNDMLDGGAGNDQLEGGRGDDILIGGDGDDVLMGGEGFDTYIFDYNSGSDRIRYDTSYIIQMPDVG